MVPAKEAVPECIWNHDPVVAENDLGSLNDTSFAMQRISVEFGMQTLVLELSLANDFARNRKDVFVIILIETIFQEEDLVDCSFLNRESAKSVGDDVFDTLDVDDLWGAFFHNQTPAADSVSAEVVEGEIAMIGADVDEVSQEDGAELAESFNNGEQFQFSNSVAGLRVQELARVEGERLLALHDDCAKLVFGCVGANVERN